MTAYADRWLERYERDAKVYAARSRACFKSGDTVAGMSFMRASLRASVAAHRIRNAPLPRTSPAYLTVRIRVV